MGGVGGNKSLSKAVLGRFTVKTQTPEQSTGIIMRHNGHHHDQGYNPRLMPSIWCAPQALSCQSYIYKVLEVALRKAVFGFDIQCNCSY